MDPQDIDIEEKNFAGNVDRAVVNLGLVFLAIVPTYFYLVFRPKSMIPLLRGEEPHARHGLKLGPGLTFVFTILLLLAVGYFIRDIAGDASSTADTARASSGIRAAVSEGNLWRSIILSLPLYFAALTVGVIIQLSHVIMRKKAELTHSISAGLYSLSTLLILILPIGIFSERFAAENTRPDIVFGIVIVAIFAILPWQVFNFSKQGYGHSTRSAAAIALLTMFLSIIAMTAFGATLAAFTES